MTKYRITVEFTAPDNEAAEQFMDTVTHLTYEGTPEHIEPESVVLATRRAKRNPFKGLTQ